MDTTHWLLVAAGVLVLLLVLWRLARRPAKRLPYTKRRSLLTAAEIRFYRVLLGAMPSGLVVFVKIRLMDVVAVPDGMWQEYGAQGSGMHCDFVLADAATLEARLVVELDDRSHRRPEARQRDAFKDAALASAGMPILRVRAAGRYDPANLAERIREALAG